MKHSIVLLFILSIFWGCASDEQKINLDQKPAKQYSLKQQHPHKRYKGSLYSNTGTSLFADKKDLQIGDILQVNIEESLTNDSKNTKALSKKNSTSLGGGIFAATKGVTLGNGATKTVRHLNDNLGIGFNSTTANSFNGSATSKNSEKFETVISVIITDIYKNGNYFIKGSKELLINNQKQTIAISGVIRPYDISPDNTVLSSQIANLKVLYKKDGDETDTLQKSWGTKLIETIWPF